MKLAVSQNPASLLWFPLEVRGTPLASGPGMAARTLAELEAEVAGIPLFKLLERYRACSKDGHAWRRLDAPELTATEADWCGRCLRVRTRSFEGWLARMPESTETEANAS